MLSAVRPVDSFTPCGGQAALLARKVNQAANKHQIKDAVEQLYNVKVADVRTMNRKGKPRRSRFKITKTSAWKRAVVVLREDSRIDLF